MHSESKSEERDCPPIPRNMRTPISDAGEVVLSLADVFQEIGDDAGDYRTAYIENIFGKMFKEEDADGDKQLADFDEEIEKHPDEAAKFALIHAILIATAYAIQAMKSAKAADALHCADAWRYAADAKHWQGIVIATWAMQKEAPISISDFARKGADARHFMNREYKEKAIAAYLAGNFKSKDQAAEAIARDVVPLTFRVVRDYLKGI